MATYYIDPAASDDLGSGLDWANALKTVTGGVNKIAFTAGKLILKNSLLHTLPDDGDLDIRCNAAVEIVNEDDDEDYTKVEITADTNVKLRQNQVGGISIKGVTFKDSSHTTNPLFTVVTDVADWTFTGVKLTNIKGSATSNGNLINLSSGANGQLTMTNCVIDGCENEHGSQSMSKVFNCSVTIDNLTMSNCGDSTAVNVGAWLITANVASSPIVTTIRNSTFTDNYHIGDGGCFYFYANATTNVGSTHTVTVENSTFTRCQADLKGGGFWFGLDVLGYAIGCTFTDCVGGTALGSAAFGKGTSVVQATNQHIEAYGCLMVRCTSPLHGGAVSIEDGSYGILRNLTFVDCTSTGGIDEGEAIYVYEKDITHDATLTTITDCIFVGAATNSHIYGAAGAGIERVKNCIVQGGSAFISDAGATVTIITDATEAQTLDSNYVPLTTGGAYSAGTRNWTLAASTPLSANGEPYTKIFIDMGGIQSTHHPFHAANM